MVQFLVEHGADANPRLGKQLTPYWLELWKQQSKSTTGVNYPLILYLMFHDKGLIIAVSATILAIILAIIGTLLALFFIKRTRKKERIETT